LTLRSFFKKYQKRDLATTTLGAKIRIRKSLGEGSCSEGSLRPTTYSIVCLFVSDELNVRSLDCIPDIRGTN
jgi:hypothetical protein